MTLKICYALFCDICEGSVIPPAYYEHTVSVPLVLPTPSISSHLMYGGKVLCKECARYPSNALYTRINEVREQEEKEKT